MVKVKIFSESDLLRDYIGWRLWDPYIISKCVPSLMGENDKGKSDLVILTARPEKGETLKAFLKEADRSPGLIAVQPAHLGETLSDGLAARFNVRSKGWGHETPRYSVAARHPFIRSLERSIDRQVSPHVPFEWYMKADAPRESVATRLMNGKPDIIFRGQSVLVTTNLFSDLWWYAQHPEFWEYEYDTSLLLVNMVRGALSQPPLSLPPPRHYRSWRFHFYGYGYARQFITELKAWTDRAGSSGAGRTVESDLIEADSRIRQAAIFLLANNIEGVRSCFKEAAVILCGCRQRLCPVEPYMARGWHGGVLDHSTVDGEVVGYAEWGWPSQTMKFIEERLSAAEGLGYKQTNEISGQTWDVIADYNLTDLGRWQAASEQGLIETVKGTYSDSYLEILGTESNIRQFEYGLRALRRIGADVRTYLRASDDFGFHPQVPQILKGFGFDFAVLRCGGPGTITGFDYEQMLWKGLDGTEIWTAPTYKTVPRQSPILVFKSKFIAESLIKAEQAGFQTILMGGTVDAGHYLHGEKEFEAFNSHAPVMYIPTTYPEYFERAKRHPDPVFLGVDSMLGHPDFWSGFGSINEYCYHDRRVERLLVAAEKLSVLSAAQTGRPYPAEAFHQAWRDLLSHQDHFTYGCGGPDNAEGYHVGGLTERQYAQAYPGPRTPITCDETTLKWRGQAEQWAGSDLEKTRGGLMAGAARSSGQGPGKVQVTVYNYLNWERSGEVRAWVPLSGSGNDVIVSDGHAASPAIVLKRRGKGRGREGYISFLARVPSLGFRVYDIETAAQGVRNDETGSRPDPHVIENEYLRAVFSSRTGGLTSLTDKRNGRELIKKGETTRFVCAYPQIDSSKDRALIETVRSDAVAMSVIISGSFASHPYRLTVTLPSHAPLLAFDLELDYGAGAVFGFKGGAETVLRTVIPLAQEGRSWVNQPFGVYETKNDYQLALDFADISDGKTGVAVLNNGVPGHRFIEGNVELLISDGCPPLRGKHHYRWALYPHVGDSGTGDCLRRAYEFQQDLAASVCRDGQPFALPCARAFVECTEGVILSGMQMSDTGLICARFFAADGRARKVETQWSFEWQAADEARLDGQRRGAVEKDGTCVRFDLAAGQIFTLTGKAKEADL